MPTSIEYIHTLPSLGVESEPTGGEQMLVSFGAEHRFYTYKIGRSSVCALGMMPSAASLAFACRGIMPVCIGDYFGEGSWVVRGLGPRTYDTMAVSN